MRIRIALTTAVAVTLIPLFLLTMFTSSPAASARHEASGRHRTSLANTKLMSYSQAEKKAHLATSSLALIAREQAAQKAANLAAFARAVALHQQQVAAQDAAARAAAAQAAATAAAAAHPAPAPAPAAAPTSAIQAAPTGGPSDATSTDTPDWACIRQHESGDNYGVGNGGAYQFELGTWEGLTGLTTPAQDSPPAVQDAAALTLYGERGWEPWTTRYVCGL